jgi:hypothetical protein
MPREKDLDRALEGALKDDAAFRQWLKQGGNYPKYAWSRSNSPWTKVKLLLPNKQDWRP